MDTPGPLSSENLISVGKIKATKLELKIALKRLLKTHTLEQIAEKTEKSVDELKEILES